MKNELEKEAQTRREAEVGFLRRCSQIPSLMHLCLYAGADGAPTTGIERSRGGETWRTGERRGAEGGTAKHVSLHSPRSKNCRKSSVKPSLRRWGAALGCIMSQIISPFARVSCETASVGTWRERERRTSCVCGLEPLYKTDDRSCA